MKRNNAGFSLIEIVAAIAVLGIFFGTACSALVLSHQLNLKTEATLQAQLAVSTAVETLMAEGIDPTKIENGNRYPSDENLEITVTALTKDVTVSGLTMTRPLHCYEVEVHSTKADVSVTTHIREKKVVAES